MKPGLSRAEILITRFCQPLVLKLVQWHIKPNLLTLLGLCCSLVLPFLFIKGWLVVCGLTIVVVELFDILDGEVARVSGRPSRFGAFFDSTIDRFTEGMIFLGLVAYFYELHIALEALTILAFIGSFLVSYTRARAEGLDVRNPYWRNVGILRRKKRLAIIVFGCWCGAIPVIGTYLLAVAIGILAFGCNYTAWQRILYVQTQTITQANPATDNKKVSPDV